jgi:hypothetical protein
MLIGRELLTFLVLDAMPLHDVPRVLCRIQKPAQHPHGAAPASDAHLL